MKKWMMIFPAMAIVILALWLCLGNRSPEIDFDQHPQLIAHAGGEIYGYRLTNSLEAIENAYASGFRYMELDFDLTTDDAVVLIHGWEGMCSRLLGSPGQRSLSEFQNSDTFMNLTLLTLDDLLTFLKKHPDVSIITDVKSENNLQVLSKIREQAGKYSQNFIPQIYEYDQYETVKELGYERIILTLYRMNADYEELGAFVREKSLWAVTMSESIVSEELLTAVNAGETPVYCHAVNDLSFFESWHEKGVTGIYTDYFTPNHWPEIE